MEEKLLGREEEFWGKEFLACVGCYEVNPIIKLTEGGGGDPRGAEEIKEEELNFMARHVGKKHRFVKLVATNFFSDKLFFEPVRDGWYEVCDVYGRGSERFVIKESRSLIEEPFCYELLRGRIKTSVEEISLQEENIKKQLRQERPVWPDEKAEEIIEIIKGALEIDREYLLDKLSKQFSFLEKNGVIATTNHPLWFLLGLSPEFVNFLGCSVRPVCNPEEWSFISNFIEENKGPDGLLAIRVKMRFRPVIIAK